MLRTVSRTRIPNGQVDILALEVNGFDLEVDANGVGLVGLKFVLGVAEEDRGLAHARIAQLRVE